jgi:hypothetical protein
MVNTEDAERFLVACSVSSGILLVLPPTRGGGQREKGGLAAGSGPLVAPRWKSQGSRSNEALRVRPVRNAPGLTGARFLATGFRGIQVLVGGKARARQVAHTTNKPTDPSGICIATPQSFLISPEPDGSFLFQHSPPSKSAIPHPAVCNDDLWYSALTARLRAPSRRRYGFKRVKNHTQQGARGENR